MNFKLIVMDRLYIMTSGFTFRGREKLLTRPNIEFHSKMKFQIRRHSLIINSYIDKLNVIIGLRFKSVICKQQ